MSSDLEINERFINRELSWIEFNGRVLEEAQDINNPLFERVKFASIVSSNLDEFFMIRVSAIKEQISAGLSKPDFSGMTPKMQMDKISEEVHKQVINQYNCYNKSLLLALKREKIYILKQKELSDEQIKFIKSYYVKSVFPVLTPMVVDNSRPFPLILNKTLNIALLIEDKKAGTGEMFATVQVPSVLKRLVEIPSCEDKRTFILLEDIIKMNLSSLFCGHNILAAGAYRITRNADLTLDEEGAEDLLEAIEESLKKRKWGDAIRLEIENGMNKELLSILEDELEVSPIEEYEISGPLDLTFLMKLSSLEGFDYLRYKKEIPVVKVPFEKDDDIFKYISQNDILLHHPYDSFETVVDLVKRAAEDPNVLAIKQTLYRVSGNSPIVAALEQAAERGKQVTVLVELKARFDEQNNIQWAKRLEKSGCHVIYGLVGLKTHCKVLLIVRKEEDGIKRYVHLGTGNYNDVTAKLYTDLGLITSDNSIGSDASALFNMLSGHSEPSDLYKFKIAPLNLRQSYIQMINNEAENAKAGKKAKIIAQMNSLVDKEIIEALYNASNSGVEINLIVRGICCLRPGVANLSENITVRSVVGRYLEHRRIYYFYDDGNEAIYLSSADWMNRNLDRRVELLFPIESAENKDKIKKILKIVISDTAKTRILNSNGKYKKIDKRGRKLINSQEVFQNVEKKEQEMSLIKSEITFKPIISYKHSEY